MALPPTRIYAYISTPERTFARLKEDGLLREDVDEADFLRAMRAVEESYHMPEGMVGPNLTDQTAYALMSFLNETGRELAMTPRYSPEEVQKANEETPEEGGSPVKEIVGAVAGLALLVAVPTGLYLGLLTVLGIRGDPSLRTIHYVLGSALALFTAVVISLVGESLIEDVVKFVLFAGGAFAIWAGKTTPASAIMLGIAVGAFLPLLARLTWGRKRKSPGESPPGVAPNRAKTGVGEEPTPRRGPLPDAEPPPPTPPPDRSGR